ncbi:MAG: DUF417 family protein [Chitinophagaceae bacterium]
MTNLQDTIAVSPPEKWGAIIIRYGLALVLIWIGLLKFTSYEAAGIEPLAAHSPLLSWALRLSGGPIFSRMLGFIEIAIGLLIAARSFSPKLSAFGSAGAMVTFVITLTLMFSTPGVVQPGYSFPFISAIPGQFLIKDIVLLGASVWTYGEAMHSLGATNKQISNQ